MSGNLNQSVRRTITNTPPIVSLMKSSPKRTYRQTKKKYYPGVFFKTAPKNEDLFTIMLSFVLSLFLEQKQEDMSMTINDDIKQACEVMQRGGIILYPTDTIWGIGCDATNAEAVQRVYKIKQRADSKALIILTDSEAKVEYYVSEVPETAWQLLDVAVKPLTLIYPGARNLATNLLADDGSIAIRITKEPFSQRLCRQFRKAIVSTSANISGNAAPHNFSEISDEIKNAVDYIVTARRDEIKESLPSSIIKLEADGTIKIIRE